jgi:hypothetical protein
MKLNSQTIHDVVHPTAAFAIRNTYHQVSHPEEQKIPWRESQLNPKNRIDSLAPLPNPLWRIDGCTGLGTQFYSVPLFLEEASPMRFDVFIPEEIAASPCLRELLDLDTAFHTKDATRVRRLGITRHILRALQVWTLKVGLSSVTSMYRDLPFGSRIIFQSLELNIHNINIVIAHMHNLERQLLSIIKLDKILGIPHALLPQPVDIAKLSFLQQLHDSVCLVSVSDPDCLSTPETYIFKALTSGSKYLYHELKTLLLLPPHPHITSPPRYLVTKQCRFGGKTAVVGMLLPYYRSPEPDSLRDALPRWRINNQLSLPQLLDWATQLSSAVLHVREQGKLFYPDLRLDNIVLDAELKVKMVDFEQRGVWCEFGAPEVNAIDYIRILAQAEPFLPDDAADEPCIPKEVQLHYANILTRLLPGWESLDSREDYTPPSSNSQGYTGYNLAWLCLHPVEQEAAEVYMLGRVLWCLFEGQSVPQPGAVWQSYVREPDLEFPAYRRTPERLRGLIDRCTKGRRDTLSSLVARRVSKLTLRDGEGHDAEEVLRVARAWWTGEVSAAEEFLSMRAEWLERGEWKGNYFGRPRLREVLAELDAYKEESLSTGVE